MNATLAKMLMARIEDAGFAFVDKTAGLVRAIPDKRDKTKTAVIPVSCEVNDPLACDDGTIMDLLPDPKYRSVLFFEGSTMPQRIIDRVLGRHYESRLRLIGWVNCEKLGGSCQCADVAVMQLMDLLNRRLPSSTPFKDMKVVTVGGGPTGKDIFSKYTFDEATTQYLHYPFDAFCLDLTVNFRLFPGCSEESVAEDTSCWNPPMNPRRRYPKDFTAEELNDPDTGLTDEQRAAVCF